MRSDDLLRPQNRLATEVIDLQALFDDYSISNKHEVTVLSQS